MKNFRSCIGYEIFQNIQIKTVFNIRHNMHDKVTLNVTRNILFDIKNNIKVNVKLNIDAAIITPHIVLDFTNTINSIINGKH